MCDRFKENITHIRSKASPLVWHIHAAFIEAYRHKIDYWYITIFLAENTPFLDELQVIALAMRKD